MKIDNPYLQGFVFDYSIEAKEQREQIYNYIEQLPSFPGGNEEMIKWLSENIINPNTGNGEVLLRFIVRSDGSITDIDVLRSIHESCAKEAIRVVKSMPEWIPGKQDGQAVSVYYTLPLIFRFRLRN